MRRPRNGACTSNVLLVDDEERIALMGKTMLERLGYQVTAVINSRQALSLIKLNPERFDLLLTDFAMPQLNGLELAQQAFKIQPEMPVVLLSGYIPAQPGEYSRNTNIVGSLLKPVTTSMLGKAINQALSSSRLTN